MESDHGKNRTTLMPNWVENTIKVKGKNENILNFLNEGVKNSNGEPKSTVKEAYDYLKDNAKTYLSGTGLRDISVENCLSMGTFRKQDESFLRYDTTNPMPTRYAADWNSSRNPYFNSDEEYEKYVEEHNAAAEYQKEKYGVVGWYDANCQYYYGCKWNSAIDNGFEVEIGEETSIVTFAFDTAWSIPTLWMRWIKEEFKVNVFDCAFEESNAFNCYFEIGGEEIEGEPEYVDEDDFESEDEYYDALYEAQCAMKEKLLNDYLEYVDNYEVDA